MKDDSDLPLEERVYRDHALAHRVQSVDSWKRHIDGTMLGNRAYQARFDLAQSFHRADVARIEFPRKTRERSFTESEIIAASRGRNVLGLLKELGIPTTHKLHVSFDYEVSVRSDDVNKYLAATFRQAGLVGITDLKVEES